MYHKSAGPESAVSRVAGQAVVVAHGDARGGISTLLQQQGLGVVFADEPYEAMVELSRRPLSYRALVLSLQGVYREELGVISSIKSRFPHVEIFLAHTDGRQAAVAEAVRLGADGLISEEGIFRTSNPPSTPPQATPISPPASTPAPPPTPPQRETPSAMSAEPLLSAEELRALLDDEPSVIGGGT